MAASTPYQDDSFQHELTAESIRQPAQLRHGNHNHAAAEQAQESTTRTDSIFLEIWSLQLFLERLKGMSHDMALESHLDVMYARAILGTHVSMYDGASPLR